MPNFCLVTKLYLGSNVDKSTTSQLNRGQPFWSLTIHAGRDRICLSTGKWRITETCSALPSGFVVLICAGALLSEECARLSSPTSSSVILDGVADPAIVVPF